METMQVLLLLCAVGIVHLVPLQDKVPPRKADTCGYESCHVSQPGILNIHIVPHTHDDVGWLKTVDQYYYGSRNNIQKAGVQYILDSVIKELWEDPKRRFIYVETAFFWKWWVRQTDAVQQKVHTLLKEGRLQMVGGAWSMNDEAASHYQSTLDQFTWGLSKLNKTFGFCGRPRVGWQIDPFGHSREFASLLSMMGYDGLFLGRIDYQDKRNRLQNKHMEMVWRGDDNLGQSSDLFTGVLYNTYSPPPGFCFDVLCSDEPIIDDPDSPMYNVENKIKTFMDICDNMSRAYRTNNILITMGEDFNYQDAAMWFINLDRLIELVYHKLAYISLRGFLYIGFGFQFNQMRLNISILHEATAIRPPQPNFWVTVFLDTVINQARYYRTNNVILTMGGDFTYQDAAMWYINLDKLIQYTNLKAAKEGMNVTMFYSTPDCYLKAVRDANPTLPTKQDDFFPYASDPTAYWTGYFTSRPTTKYFEREANNYLQMVKQLQVLADLEKHNEFVLSELRSAMGVMQHHDAITGTEKQHVTHDYERMLNQAIDDALIIAKQAFNKLTQKDATKPPIFDFQRCHLNESRCDVSENSEKFVVTIYNPLGWSLKEPIRIPVVDGTYEVYAPDGSLIKSQLVKLPNRVINIPTRVSKATHEIVFIIHMKPLFYKSVYIKKTSRSKRENKKDYELYTNINGFWQDLKEPPYYNYKPLNDKNFNNDNGIPLAPVMSPEIFNSDYKDVNLDILKDGNNDDEVGELEKYLKDERRRMKSGGRIIPFPNLNDEEMRMLSDEPRTVEKFDDEVELGNEFYKLDINTASGMISQITFPDHTTLNFTTNMYYYSGACGDNRDPARRSSGAYIFRPITNNPTKLDTQKTDIINGDIVKEFRVNLSPNGYINTKIYDGLNFIETEWIVGPIQIDDNTGKEYVIKYETNIINNGEFYTDSNGRQILKRKLNSRPQYNLTLAEPVAGNYYPVTNEIYIENDDVRVTVLTDRAEGGTSLIEGEVELMLHRRLLCDDAFGVGEALNETANDIGLVVRGNHRIIIGKDKEFIAKNVLGLHLKPQVLFSDAKDLTYDEWMKLNNHHTWLAKELPRGIHLLTLEPWDSKLLIRIENYLDKDDNSNVEVDLKEMFTDIEIKGVKETMLAANIWVDEYQKWIWNKENDFENNFDETVDDVDGNFKITLKAKQIRTFIADYVIKKN